MKFTTRIHLIITIYLLEQVDEAAAKTQMNRSEFITHALQEYLYSRRIMLQIDPTTLTDEEVEEAYDRMRRERVHRRDPDFYT